MKEIKKILSALESCDFNYLSELAAYDQIVKPFKSRYKEEFCYDLGATKLVLIFRKINYVLKIPFKYTNEGIIFMGAQCENGWDYCQVEVDIFKKAVAQNVDFCFLPLKQIKEFNTYPVYLQEKIEIWDNENIDVKTNYNKQKEEEMFKTLKKVKGNPFSRLWLIQAYSTYGEANFIKMMDFIYDYEIIDLHSANLGMKKGYPIIVDYASFDEAWDCDNEEEEIEYEF